ncbi:hypothetical protein ACJJTC_005195 [Scirpophaga incertulas]
MRSDRRRVNRIIRYNKATGQNIEVKLKNVTYNNYIIDALIIRNRLKLIKQLAPTDEEPIYSEIVYNRSSDYRKVNEMLKRSEDRTMMLKELSTNKQYVKRRASNLSGALVTGLAIASTIPQNTYGCNQMLYIKNALIIRNRLKLIKQLAPTDEEPIYSEIVYNRSSDYRKVNEMLKRSEDRTMMLKELSTNKQYVKRRASNLSGALVTGLAIASTIPQNTYGCNQMLYIKNALIIRNRLKLIKQLAPTDEEPIYSEIVYNRSSDYRKVNEMLKRSEDRTMMLKELSTNKQYVKRRASNLSGALVTGLAIASTIPQNTYGCNQMLYIKNALIIRNRLKLIKQLAPTDEEPIYSEIVYNRSSDYRKVNEMLKRSEDRTMMLKELSTNKQYVKRRASNLSGALVTGLAIASTIPQNTYGCNQMLYIKNALIIRNRLKLIKQLAPTDEEPIYSEIVYNRSSDYRKVNEMLKRSEDRTMMLKELSTNKQYVKRRASNLSGALVTGLAIASTIPQNTYGCNQMLYIKNRRRVNRIIRYNKATGQNIEVKLKNVTYNNYIIDALIIRNRLKLIKQLAPTDEEPIYSEIVYNRSSDYRKVNEMLKRSEDRTMMLKELSTNKQYVKRRASNLSGALVTGLGNCLALYHKTPMDVTKCCTSKVMVESAIAGKCYDLSTYSLSLSDGGKPHASTT